MSNLLSKRAAKAAVSVTGSKSKAKSRSIRPDYNDFSVLEQFEDNAEDSDVLQELERLNVSGVEASAPGSQLQQAISFNNDNSWLLPPQRKRVRQPSKVVDIKQARGWPATGSIWETSTNWRAPQDPMALAARWAGANTLRTTKTRGTYRPGPRTTNGVLHANLIQGTIIWHWDIRPYRSMSIPDSDSRIIKNPDGTMSLKKGRYWLIVGSTSKTIWEVPIYTNNDTGLQKVPPRHHKDYFSLCPKGMSTDTFPNQSSTNKVISIDWLDANDGQMRGNAMRTTMVAHVAEVMTRDINEEPVRIVGAIAEADIEVVCQKACKHFPK
ncbi:hypothetical protein LTR86_000172 [Recurvomyces mirabilis]|nr:hypothetical protein LTR86_000172 [Recurvomyces mirabilis]